VKVGSCLVTEPFSSSAGGKSLVLAVNYSPLKNTLRNLTERYEHWVNLLADFPDPPNYLREALDESVMRRFRLCHDVLWKTVRLYLREELGLAAVPYEQRPLLRVSYKNGLTPAGFEQWDCYAQTRNRTTQEHSDELAAEVLTVVRQFIPDAIRLYETMTGESWQ